ncbi:MAG: NPCBM/NEW2 domain-containing protein [Lentisphaerales bacterium]|nr:NPCBM/NEW2 domain-containing protein [Lentisphaerales bacterium]
MIRAIVLLLIFSTSVIIEARDKHIVFIAGHHTLQNGEHEFSAGVHFLAKQINRSGLSVKASVVDGYWPEDEKELLEADAMIIYSDGLGNHVINNNFDTVNMWIKDGKGVGFLHTACKVPKGKKSQMMTSWTGGFYEQYFSTDPEWLLNASPNQAHEISKGVGKINLRDKWLFNIRFKPKMKGVQSILEGIPDDLARSGKHTSHRSKIESVFERKGEKETLMWVYEGEDQGRSFVFTGGHYHDTWKSKSVTRLVLNAALWSVGMKVPDKGFPVEKFSDLEMAENMSRDRSEFIWQEERSILMKSKLLFSSKVITDKTAGKSVMIDVDVKGYRELILLVLDGGDGIRRDHAVWAYPVLTGVENELQVSLTELEWEQGLTGWRQIHLNRGLDGHDLKLNGREVQGIAAHSVSVIRYKIPEGMIRFQTTAGQADSRNGGSLQFQVYAR